MDRSQLKVVVAGSVDHGKSTLIGRLLYDTHSLTDQQMAGIQQLSHSADADAAFAFVLDRFHEEQTGRKTIDTAQVFFCGQDRDYVIIDAPGHKEFMRNMITGASQASAALLLVDVGESLTRQTRCHAATLSFLGIRQVVVVVNKMDAVGFAAEPFQRASETAAALLAQVGACPLAFVPASALNGDNIITRSPHTAWYAGPTVLGALDLFHPPLPKGELPFRMPVQDVYAVSGRSVAVGRVVSGTVAAGQRIAVCPGGSLAAVERLEMFESRLSVACAGQSIGLVLEPADGLRRGQVLCAVGSPPNIGRRVPANVLWMSPAPLRQGEEVVLRIATQEVPCRVGEIRHRQDSGTLTVLQEYATELGDAEIGQVIFSSDESFCWDRFAFVPEMGRLVVVRGMDTVAGGIVVQENMA